MNILNLGDQNKERSGEPPVHFDRKEIMQFARDHWKEGNRWNGRQIKNAFQTAVALADWDRIKAESKSRPKLERKHFETVATASAHFDRYLVEVRNTDQSRAKTNEVRRDDLTNDMKGYRSRSLRGKSPITRKPSLPQWPAGDGRDDSEESTTDTSGSEDEASEPESESEPEPEPEPVKKKKKGRDEGSKKKKSEGPKARSGKRSRKQEEVERKEVKSKSKDKSTKSKSSKKSKQETEPSGESESESLGPGSGW